MVICNPPLDLRDVTDSSQYFAKLNFNLGWEAFFPLYKASVMPFPQYKATWVPQVLTIIDFWGSLAFFWLQSFFLTEIQEVNVKKLNFTQFCGIYGSEGQCGYLTQHNGVLLYCHLWDIFCIFDFIRLTNHTDKTKHISWQRMKNGGFSHFLKLYDFYIHLILYTYNF